MTSGTPNSRPGRRAPKRAVSRGAAPTRPVRRAAAPPEAPRPRPPVRQAPSGPRSSPSDLIRRALERRAGLLADERTTCLRLFHGAVDGMDGCVIERLGEALVVQIHAGRLAADEALVRQLCEAALVETGARAVYRKLYPRDRSHAPPEFERQHFDPTPWLGTPLPAEVEVLENGLRFLVRPYDGYSTGLFLEQRANRALAAEYARGARVLNLFAYTCGFAVAAARAGAAETVNVDISKKALEWGKRNFTANDLELGGQVFLCTDARDYLGRAARQGRRFELVILDPPSFSRSRQGGRVFAVEDELEGLLALTLPVLAPGGRLLVSTNHRAIGEPRLRAAARTAASVTRNTITDLRPGELPPDFPGDPGYSKSLWVTVRG